MKLCSASRSPLKCYEAFKIYDIHDTLQKLHILISSVGEYKVYDNCYRNLTWVRHLTALVGQVAPSRPLVHTSDRLTMRYRPGLSNFTMTWQLETSHNGIRSLSPGYVYIFTELIDEKELPFLQTGEENSFFYQKQVKGVLKTAVGCHINISNQFLIIYDFMPNL